MPDATVTDAVAAVEAALNVIVRQSHLPRAYERLAARAGLPLDRASYMTLVRISEEEPLRLSDLAVRLDVDLSTASRQVRRMEERGLVARRADEADRRAALLSLTAEGVDVLARSRASRQEAVAELLAGWDEADIAKLASLLTRLVAAATVVA